MERDNIYKQWDLFVQLLLTASFEECENHDATTTAEVSDDENVLGSRKKTKKTFTDFITGLYLGHIFFCKKKSQSCFPLPRLTKLSGGYGARYPMFGAVSENSG